MPFETPSRRHLLTALAGTTTLGGGCLGRVLHRPTVRLSGVRIHNWVEAESTVTVELHREGTPVLDERVSLAPLREPGSVVSFPAAWSVDPARYRVSLTVDNDQATLDRTLPPAAYRWDGCAFLDADIEPGRNRDGTPDTKATRFLEAHLEEVTASDDFSAGRCPTL